MNKSISASEEVRELEERARRPDVQESARASFEADEIHVEACRAAGILPEDYSDLCQRFMDFFYPNWQTQSAGQEPAER